MLHWFIQPTKEERIARSIRETELSLLHWEEEAENAQCSLLVLQARLKRLQATQAEVKVAISDSETRESRGILDTMDYFKTARGL